MGGGGWEGGRGGMRGGVKGRWKGDVEVGKKGDTGRGRR